MKRILVGLVIAALAIAALIVNAGNEPAQARGAVEQELAVATFAGGCFWCVESGFEKVPGVVEAVSGYTGGHVESPTYKNVSGGSTGHIESVQLHYDPTIISYEGLLAAFWRMVDPTDTGGSVH